MIEHAQIKSGENPKFAIAVLRQGFYGVVQEAIISGKHFEGLSIIIEQSAAFRSDPKTTIAILQ